MRSLARARTRPEHSERTFHLAQVARTAGAQDLWIFTPVEGDLFLRDCVGAIPGSLEIGAVMDARERGEGPIVRETAGARTILVLRSRSGGGPLLAVAFPAGWSEPRRHEEELLDCLGFALGAAERAPDRSEGAPPPSGPVPDEQAASAPVDEIPALLRQRIDELARSWIRHALALTGGDRAEAAAELGVSEGELVSHMARLGFS